MKTKHIDIGRLACIFFAIVTVLFIAACEGGGAGARVVPEEPGPTVVITGGNKNPAAGDYEFFVEDMGTGTLTSGIGVVSFNFNDKNVIITPKSGKSSGAVTVLYDGVEAPPYPSATGIYQITFNVEKASGYNAAAGLIAGTLVISNLPVSGDFTITNTPQTYDGQPKAVTVQNRTNNSQGVITVLYNYGGGDIRDTPPVAAGSYPVTFNVTATAAHVEATGLSAGTLVINRRQLSISAPSGSPTKVWDGYSSHDGSGITIGSLSNVVSGDTVSAYISSATYDNSNVNYANNQITIVYGISGANAGNYIAPANNTIAATITKAPGIQASQPQRDASVIYYLDSRITVVSLGTFGEVQYAISFNNDETGLSAWQNERTFESLTADTTYYVYAKNLATDNSFEGDVSLPSNAITTAQNDTAQIAFIWVDENDVLAVSPGNSVIAGSTLTFNAESGFQDHAWFVNGEYAAGTGTFGFSRAVKGQYTVTLIVETTGGRYYSADFTVTVN